MKTITLSQLREHHACEEQVELFEETFGESVDITVALCESVASLFNFAWAAQYLLTPAALAEYERVAAPARAEYERVAAPARAEYERVAAPARSEYERVKARAFAEAYMKQEESKP